ncbi:MAG TPA: carboxypeptidase-like regulatory domain-containing protein, partial [Candidatus Acidoferrum sp.]
MHTFRYFCVLLLVHCSVVAMMAQADKGAVSGTVKDSTGAVLPGARVELAQNGPSAVSDSQGQFLISSLAPGTYTLNISY